jgi:hypothetical protein
MAFAWLFSPLQDMEKDALCNGKDTPGKIG